MNFFSSKYMNGIFPKTKKTHEDFFFFSSGILTKTFKSKYTTHTTWKVINEFVRFCQNGIYITKIVLPISKIKRVGGQA